jgi:hypothetical protein
MRKCVSLLLVALLMFGLMAWTSAEELTTVVYVVPGDEPKDLAGGVQAINNKLKADGTGVQLGSENQHHAVYRRKIRPVPGDE